MGQITLSAPSLNTTERLGLSARHQAIIGMVTRVIGLLQTWRERRRGRAELIGLSDSMLKDIGLSRGDAEFEYEKPFWQR